ncbi:hypothetical protein CCR75_006236 [Bremia lactucae]|uniref:FYVE-type domain-containing protein n=1 Tax=Bremia lactucae TaxID=4779 RepID=A0A976ILY1_BRELC|nr:hypothetical protein CCR75_006236 [Bremia lactucae]
MAKTLPLPPHFFQCPELTEREEQYLVGKAKESAKSLVDATRNDEGPVRWEEAGMHRGVQMYRGEARYPNAVVGESISYGCAATTIQSTLEEVADFFDVSTDAKVAELVELHPDVLDAQLLYVLEDPNLLNDPRYNARSHRSGSSKMLNANQVTVSWVAMDMGSKLVKNRDFLTVECQSTFLDVSGRRGWVRSFHSIKLPCCPELSAYNLVRGSFYHTGYVFVESDRPGFLDVIFSAQVHMKGSLKVPTPLYATIQKKRLCRVADLQKLITRRRLGAQKFLGDLDLVPKHQRTRCHLCASKFGLLTRKSRCRKCGEVVCASSCSTEWEVAITGQGVRKVRVCTKCAQHTDPNAFGTLTPSEQYSESYDDETSVRTPGYTSETYPPHASRRRSRENDETLSRRGPYTASFEASEESYYDASSTGFERYSTDSMEPDEHMISTRRRRDERNQDGYDYGPSSPRDRDLDPRRALQRQQRALQQASNYEQRLHLDAQVRRRQQPSDDASSSVLSQSSGTSSGGPSFLTSSLLALHTKQMGPAGPVTNPAPMDRSRRKERAPRLAAPAMPTDRPLTRLEQIQVKLWEEQEARFRDESAALPASTHETDAPVRRRRSSSSEGSAKRRGVKLPSYFRSVEIQGHGAPTGESPSAKPPPFPKVLGTHSGQTISVADDEDHLEDGLAMTFGSLLRFEDLRPTEDSVRLSFESMPLNESGAFSIDQTIASNVAIRTLYERILVLTNKQHELEVLPEADGAEKEEVARELKVLYDQLRVEKDS